MIAPGTCFGHVSPDTFGDPYCGADWPEHPYGCPTLDSQAECLARGYRWIEVGLDQATCESPGEGCINFYEFFNFMPRGVLLAVDLLDKLSYVSEHCDRCDLTWGSLRTWERVLMIIHFIKRLSLGCLDSWRKD